MQPKEESRMRSSGARQRLTHYRGTEKPEYLEGCGMEADQDRETRPPAGAPLVTRRNDERDLQVLEELNARMQQLSRQGVFHPTALHRAAPAVNRDLKPGRRINMLDEHEQPMDPNEQHIELSPRSSGSMLPKDLAHHISTLNLHKASRQQSSKAQRPTYYDDDWYAGTCDRADAEHALHLFNKDGAFLVRDCSNRTHLAPFVLAVYHDKKVYNVKIRFIEDKNKYALGTGQRGNDMFDTVGDIIKYHSIFPIVIINMTTKTAKAPQNCILTTLITRDDINKLLR